MHGVVFIRQYTPGIEALACRVDTDVNYIINMYPRIPH